MKKRIRSIATDLWCENKNIRIDKEILESDLRGVYGFFVQYQDEEKCVYIGKAINIRKRVFEHLSSVKWNTIGALTTAPSEFIKILTEAVINDYQITVKLLEIVEYKYVNYNRDLHHLAFVEYGYIEEYQQKNQCLYQQPEGAFNQYEYDVWQEESIIKKHAVNEIDL